jgi:hypothetical protein
MVNNSTNINKTNAHLSPPFCIALRFFKIIMEMSKTVLLYLFSCFSNKKWKHYSLTLFFTKFSDDWFSTSLSDDFDF